MKKEINIIAEELGINPTKHSKAIYLVHLFFDHNIERTCLWFRTKNPSLGEISPLNMILLGRYKYLLKWVESVI